LVELVPAADQRRLSVAAPGCTRPHSYASTARHCWTGTCTTSARSYDLCPMDPRHGVGKDRAMRMSWLPTRKTITAVMDGVHDDAKGAVALTLDRVNGRVCFKLAWSGIGSPVAAHIHTGSGPAVLSLFVNNPKRHGCVKADKSLLRKLAECPSRYHVMLHTERYPSGALRAQL
jgi:hypothetical protein